MTPDTKPITQTAEYLYKQINKNDEWETPKKLYRKLDQEFNFELDACASNLNHKCDKYFTKEDNALIQNWKAKSVFCNPPYSEIGAFVKKSYCECKKGNAETVVLLCFSKTETKWFHKYILGKAEIRFIKGRVAFELNGQSGKQAPFGTMIVIWRKEQLANEPDLMKFFSQEAV